MAARPAKKITKLTRIDPERVDGVTEPANGFPILMMKAVNAQGGIDEKPDIAGAQGVIVDLFKLIQSEAAEGATGAFGEIYDIQLLAEALCAMRCFLSMERMGDEDDGEPMYKGLLAKEAESLAGYVFKRKISAARRKELASEGNALPDGSYPIENEEDLHNAAILARSGHGDAAGAKRLIARRAKELGVSNPLAAHAQKETEEAAPVADEGQDVTKETETSETGESQEGQPEVPELVKSAIAEAVKPLEAANQELRAELAKLKDTPIPGGPLLTVPAGMRETQAKAEGLAKAAYFRKMADRVSDRELKKYYRDRAAEAEAA